MQGDPLAMAMFGLATVPLIRRIATQGATQAWFADDAGCGGHLLKLRRWWDLLCDVGPKFGYYPNAAKTFLVAKPEREDEARTVFSGTW